MSTWQMLRNLIAQPFGPVSKATTRLCGRDFEDDAVAMMAE
jgi:hypothetical protein